MRSWVSFGIFEGTLGIVGSRGGPLGIDSCYVGQRSWAAAGRLIFPQSEAWGPRLTGIPLRCDRSMVSANSGWLILGLCVVLLSPTSLSGKSPENPSWFSQELWIWYLRLRHSSDI